MSTAYESWSAGSLRIGDAERVTAASALGDHFAAGRLDQDELDQRLSAAYAARTFADLAPLFADLPEPRPVRPVATAPAGRPVEALRKPRPGRVGGRGPAGWGVWAVSAIPLPLLLFGAFLVISIIGTVAFFAPFVLIPLFWFWFVGGRGRWRHHRGCRWR